MKSQTKIYVSHCWLLIQLAAAMSLFQTCNASLIDTNTNLDSEYRLDLITDQKPDELGFEEPIRCELIMISSNASPKTLFLPDDVEYRYRVDLFDSNNHAVDKTELGKRIGSEFGVFAYLSG